jgi:hypothetical protein
MTDKIKTFYLSHFSKSPQRKALFLALVFAVAAILLVDALFIVTKFSPEAFNVLFASPRRYSDAAEAASERSNFFAVLILTMISAMAVFGALPLLLQRSMKRDDVERNDEVQKALREFAQLQAQSGRRSAKELETQKAEVEALKAKLLDQYAAQPDEQKIFQGFQRRMDFERDRIRNTARSNLIFGLAFSIAALLILGFPLLVDIQSAVTTGDKEIYLSVVQRTLPRVSLGVLVQIVGFFFLRLYVTNEMDLKHTKNEVTNFEAWMIAVALAKRSDNDVARTLVLRRMIETERNFILRKGDRTISIENDSKYNDVLHAIEAIGKKLAEVNARSAESAAS